MTSLYWAIFWNAIKFLLALFRLYITCIFSSDTYLFHKYFFLIFYFLLFILISESEIKHIAYLIHRILVIPLILIYCHFQLFPQDIYSLFHIFLISIYILIHNIFNWKLHAILRMQRCFRHLYNLMFIDKFRQFFNKDNVCLIYHREYSVRLIAFFALSSLWVLESILFKIYFFWDILRWD